MSTRLVQKSKWWLKLRKMEFFLKRKLMKQKTSWSSKFRGLLLTCFRHFSGQVEYDIYINTYHIFSLTREEKYERWSVFFFFREPSSPCCIGGWMSCLYNNCTPLLHGACLKKFYVMCIEYYLLWTNMYWNVYVLLYFFFKVYVLYVWC